MSDILTAWSLDQPGDVRVIHPAISSCNALSVGLRLRICEGDAKVFPSEFCLQINSSPKRVNCYDSAVKSDREIEYLIFVQ